MGDYSPEKAGVCGSTPSLATIISKDLKPNRQNLSARIQPAIHPSIQFTAALAAKWPEAFRLVQPFGPH
jgi:hypothetical protein